MITIKIDTSNFQRNITAEVSKIVRQATLMIESNAKIAIQTGPKTGRTYRRRGRTHRASARGEAPASDTGFLVGSIESNFPSALTGIVTVGAEYARMLEEILDRPFVQPAIDKTIEDIESGDAIGGIRGVGY
jgi:hypothetical protein